MREAQLQLPPAEPSIGGRGFDRSGAMGREREQRDLYSVLRTLLRALPTAVNVIVKEGDDVVVEDVGGLTRLSVIDGDGAPWRPSKEEMHLFVRGQYGEDWQTHIRKRALDVGTSLTMDDWCRINAGFVHQDALQLVLRRHPSEPLSLTDIAAPPELGTLAEEPRGLILFVGRTGAGKSTTMAAAIKHINQRQPRHIIRIEDPLEIPVGSQHSLITVREVGHDVDSADCAVVDALRQAPDVICVSEIRSRETAAALFDAADAGHLVMATVHGPNPVDALSRLCGLFGAEAPSRAKLLASVLLAVVGQIRLPRADGAGYRAFFEMLVPGPAQSEPRILIEGAKWSELRARLNSRQLPQCIPLSDTLARGVADGLVGRSVAELNAFDRPSFLKALEAIAPAATR